MAGNSAGILKGWERRRNRVVVAGRDAALVRGVHEIIEAYHLALDKREHAGVAACLAIDAIEHLFGTRWVQGAAKARAMAALVQAGRGE